ncbi:hypothetical protein EMEDMD4_570240 [Sinorhizobium medicae]|uniref:Uncharacterized protein n=1 Tax=Sinorhizobium medicae TaxID=110321 RepID=A0A508X8G3_9HYPH|nr:hypothetical protein EMEDMD4_570240 [Sinorhizobium medicae]
MQANLLIVSRSRAGAPRLENRAVGKVAADVTLRFSRQKTIAKSRFLEIDSESTPFTPSRMRCGALFFVFWVLTRSRSQQLLFCRA